MKKSPLLIDNIALGTATLLAGALGAAGNIASTLFNNSSNRSAQESANQANLDLWREQTAYNNPTNQLQRLRQAGLNPDLVYGQNGISNSAASAPQMLASQSVAPQVDPLTAAQIANINADTEKKEQEIEESKQNIIESDSRVKVNNSQVEFAGKQYELSKQLTQAQVHSLNENCRLISPQIMKLNHESMRILSEISNLDADTLNKNIDAAFKDRTFNSRIAELAADINIKRQTYDNLLQQYIYNPSLFQAQLAVSLSTAYMNLAHGEYLDSQTFAQDLENDINEALKSETIQLGFKQLGTKIMHETHSQSLPGRICYSFGQAINAFSPFIGFGTDMLNSSPFRLRGK